MSNLVSVFIEQMSEHDLREAQRIFSIDTGKYAEELELIDTRLNEIKEARIIARELRKEQQRIYNEEQKRINAIASEEKLKQQEAWLKNPLNAATKKGWEAMRLAVPNLDGVNSFEELPESLLWRYGAFARAVLGYPLEPVVKSKKQKMREDQEEDQRNRDHYGFYGHAWND